MAGIRRNLIVLADGTGNSASSASKTNVWRLYQALDLSDGKQVALFGDGVGTSSITVLRVIGLALGFGVKRNVIDLYKFLCRNYKDGDRIWIFGFSRGAFTARVLGGLINSQGLVCCETEAELDFAALSAYRAYREDAFKTMIPWVALGRIVRDKVVGFWRALTGARQYSQIPCNKAPIHFLGVWDTVVAYGLPIDELTIAVDKWVWPMKFRETSLLPNVVNARHALALDDERRTFHPVPWDERTERDIQAAQEKLVKQGEQRTIPADRLVQVWFSGMHADVGGGYPDDGLAYVPLCWMIEEAKAKGLAFEGQLVNQYNALAAPTGRMYDSRAGSGSLWRYQPRNVEFLMHRGEDNVPAADRVTPLVHHSVLTRMTYGNDGYAPFSLPQDIAFLMPDGSRVGFNGTAISKAVAANTAALAAAPPDQQPALKEMQAVLADLDATEKAPASLSHPRADYFALVLDTVWFRRIVYFATLALALVALAYPVLYEVLDFGDATAKADEVTSGFLVYVIALVRGFLPGFAAPWLDAVSANGLGAVVIGILFLFSLALSAFLQRRIHDRARVAWNVQQRAMKSLKPTGQRHALLTLALIGAVTTVFAFPAGKNSPKLFWAIAAITIVFFGLYVFRRIRPAEEINPSEPRFPLKLARKLRTNTEWVGGYRWVAQVIAPALFIVIIAYLALAVVNLSAFNVASTLGTFCPDTVGQPKTPKENLEGIKSVDIKELCNPTGLVLIAGRQYRVRIQTDDWFDKSIPADVAGISSSGLLHALFSPLKRSWREKWFQPFARVGRYGNYEYALKAAAPLAAAEFSSYEPHPPAECTELVAINEAAKKGDGGAPKVSDPAPKELMDAKLACEQRKNVTRAKVLIADFTPTHSGELFIFVNDAVIALPGLTNLFYLNNTGTALVTVQRIVAPEIIWQGAAPAQQN